jgi:hypothetical protein
MTRAARLIETPLADISASPSLGSSVIGSIPARVSADRPGRTSPSSSARPVPIATCPIQASMPRSPAPTEPTLGTTGWTRAFSMAASTSATAWLAPDPPRARPARRAIMAARTSTTGSGGP